MTTEANCCLFIILSETSLFREIIILKYISLSTKSFFCEIMRKRVGYCSRKMLKAFNS